MKENSSENYLNPVLHGFKLEDDYFITKLKMKILKLFGITSVKEMVV